MKSVLALLQSILNKYSDSELLQMCKAINKDYNIYDPEDVRWAKLEYVLNKTSPNDIKLLRENCLSNRVVNDMIFNYYFCERVIKYYFINHLRSKLDHIVAFEMSIGDSRIDICRINGSSYAYEIKTEYDTFDRLGTQMQDYVRTFEKVYVIVPHSKLDDVNSLIPEPCGIISYRITRDKKVVFSYRKRAQKNRCDIKFCLSSLSSIDMSYILRLLNEKDFKTRAEKLTRLLQISDTQSIWTQYRELLKHKYADQWWFVTQHFDQILPIDIQSFFASKMDPCLLYTK